MASVMNIPTEACPIAYPCVLSYRELVDKSPSATFRSYDEEWDEVEEAAKESNPTLETQRLRAFYALELTYHDILPSLFFTAPDSQMHGAFRSMRAARSTRGLDEVIELGEKYKKRASSKRTTVAFKNDGRDNSAQVVDLLKKHVAIVDQLVRSASQLKACLRNSNTPFGLVRVGANLGTAFFQASESDPTVIERVHTIIKINPQNAVTPWKQQTSEPAISQA